MGALALLLPLVPGLVQTVLAIVAAVRADPGTSAEQKAKLDALSAELKIVEAKVAAAVLPSGNP